VRFENKTKWDTKALVAFGRRVLRAACGVHKPRTVIFTSARGNHFSWRRVGDGERCLFVYLSLPTPQMIAPTIVDQMAQIEEGIRLTPERLGEAVQVLSQAVGGLVLSKHPDDVETGFVGEAKKPEPKGRTVGAELQQAKLTGLRDRLARWESKLQRAEKAVKKLKRQIRRREAVLKKLEAA
jgi:hypothetical protein